MYPSKPFESCLEKITYTTKIQRKDFLESGDFPIVSQEVWDINGYWNNESDVFESEKPVIIFWDHTKIIKYIDFDFVLGADGVKILQPKDFLDTRYFCYFLQSVELKSLGYARHYRLLRELNVPVPPLSVQLDIVARLDSAMAEIEMLRRETESALASTRELWESTLESVFASGGNDWEEKTLREVSIDFGRWKSKHRPRNDKKLYWWDYPFIQTGDIRNSVHFITDFSQTYNDVWLAQSKLWPKGTICITIAANIAETGILGFDSCFPDSVIWIVVDPDITNNDYMEYLLQFYKARIQSRWKWSAQANINLATFEDEFFPFPNITEQSRIVAHLDAVRAQTERLESLYTEKLASLDELRRSVLAEAFV